MAIFECVNPKYQVKGENKYRTTNNSRKTVVGTNLRDITTEKRELPRYLYVLLPLSACVLIPKTAGQYKILTQSKDLQPIFELKKLVFYSTKTHKNSSALSLSLSDLQAST